MRALPSRFGSALLVVAFVALCAVIGWSARVLAEPDSAAAPEAAAAPAPPPVPITLLPDYRIEGGIASRRDTIERPAFVPTRRPAPAAVQEAPKPRMPRNQFTLTGTAVVDQKQIAFLRETAGGKARTVRAGESINGVVVAEVKADRVKLVMGDESEELLLKLAVGPKQTIQPQAAPPPGAPGQPAGARPQVAGQPAPDSGAPLDSDASILERRRAARAALQAQQEAAARAGGQPVPAAPTTPGSVPAPAQPAAASPSSTDFSEIVRRRQQQRGR